MDNAAADEEAEADGSRRKGKGGGSWEGSRRAVVADSGTTCTRDGGHRAVRPWPLAEAPGSAQDPEVHRLPRPAAPHRCRPAATTTFAAASVRFEYLEQQRVVV